MNEHLFEQLAETYPQHERRIVDADAEDHWLAYCTVCAWYQQGRLDIIMANWATHLELVRAFWRLDGSPEPKDGDLVAAMLYDADGVPKVTVEVHRDEKFPDHIVGPEGHPV